MFNKVRKKFIILSVSALFVLLSFTVTGMNIVNYFNIVKEGDATLDIISEAVSDIRLDDRLSEGEDREPKEKRTPPDMDIPERDDKKPPGPKGRDELYDSRYFCVLTENGAPKTANLESIEYIDVGEAFGIAEKAMELEEQRGFVGEYRFLKEARGEDTFLIFLDLGIKLDSFYSFLTTGVITSFLGLVIMFIFILLASKKILHPVAESYEKQKRFITDAGHEIKTPLTIIRADADILEMEHGENEWISDIQSQAKNLSELAGNLVYMARMDEGCSVPAIEFPLSDVVSETVQPFNAPALTNGQVLECNIQPLLSVKGNEQAIRRLVCILVENSLKYSPEGSTITVELKKEGREALLSVTNKTKYTVLEESLPLLFDRFYRTDPSRNSKTGGNGIGLSIAKSIVAAHGGEICAKLLSEDTLSICATLPGVK